MATDMEREIVSQCELLPHCFDANLTGVEQLSQQLRHTGIKRIFLLARGSSANACVYFKYRLETLTDLSAEFVYPSVVTLFDGRMDMSGGALLAVSQGGRGEDINIVAERAERAGVFTAAVTNDANSRLARTVQHHLFMDVMPELSMAATKTFSAEMLVLGMLARSLAGSDPSALRGAGEVCSRVLQLRGEMNAQAERLRNVDSLFVLARGPTLAAAKEACCKLQETCFVNANAYSAAEFMHGPLALADKRMNALVFAHGDATLDGTAALLKKLCDNGASVLTLTDSRELAQQYRNSILLPECGDELFPFAAAFTAQLLACRLSSLRGVNPDASRNLNKYTQTI